MWHNLDIPGKGITEYRYILKRIIFWDMTLCSPLSWDGGDKFLRNVGRNSTDYTASYPRRWYSS
jgi:hypothetical protein